MRPLAIHGYICYVIKRLAFPHTRSPGLISDRALSANFTLKRMNEMMNLRRTIAVFLLVRFMDKMGLAVSDHLKADMDYYRKNNIKVKFDRFSVDNLNYQYAAKKYRIEDKSCDYVCYIDPGRQEQSYLIFVLTTDIKHCSKYEGLFVNMLKSFSWGIQEPAPAHSPQ
jgi:hypothetical protein